MQLSVGAAVNAAAAVKGGRDPALAMEMAAWRQQMDAERKKYFDAASAERSAAISRAISDQISQVRACVCTTGPLPMQRSVSFRGGWCRKTPLVAPAWS